MTLDSSLSNAQEHSFEELVNEAVAKITQLFRENPDYEQAKQLVRVYYDSLPREARFMVDSLKPYLKKVLNLNIKGI